MIKSLIGHTSRWIRRILDKCCTIDLDEVARELSKECVFSPPTDDEKEEKFREQILQGVDHRDYDKVIDHFKKLSQEIDPIENVDTVNLEECIVPPSSKTRRKR